jgi:hypothetical protein
VPTTLAVFIAAFGCMFSFGKNSEYEMSSRPKYSVPIWNKAGHMTCMKMIFAMITALTNTYKILPTVLYYFNRAGAFVGIYSAPSYTLFLQQHNGNDAYMCSHSPHITTMAGRRRKASLVASVVSALPK